MSRPRLFAVIVATVFLSSAAPSATVQPSAGPIGVLIGLFHQIDSERPQVPTLRTVWVQGAAPGTPVVSNELPDLLVPRRAGFWKLGLAGDCDEDDEFDVDGKVNGSSAHLQTSLWAGPLDALPAVKQNPCARNDTRCSGQFGPWIRWVWPEYISANEHSESGCGAHPGGSIAYRVQEFGARQPVSIGAVLGNATESAYRRAYAAALAEDVKEWGDQCGNARDAFDSRAWLIARESGAWRVTGFSATHRLCGVGFDYSIVADVSRVTGRRENDAARWPALKARWPEIADVHTSTGGQWTIIAAGGELLIFSGASLDGEPLRIPKGRFEEVVMVEWATGNNVARWNDQVARLRR
jgi:hypothetical protein